MDTSDEWIQQRTGIDERRCIEEGEKPVDLAQHAREQALEAANLEASDLDCILLATLSSQADFPGTSFFLHEALASRRDPVLRPARPVQRLPLRPRVRRQLHQAKAYRRVLVVGCEVHSTGIDLSDTGRDVAVLFGDGAGAVVLEANDDDDDPAGLLEVRLHAQGKHARKLWLDAPELGPHPVRIDHQMLDERRHFPRMEGRFVFKHAVTRMPEVLLETLNAASLKIADVDLFLFHQANLRINEFVANALEIPTEKCINNIERYGNCSAASIPMLLDEAIRGGRLAPGQLFSMTTFGSGFSWTSAVARL